MISFPNRILLACIGGAVGFSAIIINNAGGSLPHVWMAGFLSAFTGVLAMIAFKQASIERQENDAHHIPLVACIALIFTTVGMVIVGAIISGTGEGEPTPLIDLITNLFAGYLMGVSTVTFIALIYFIKSDGGLLYSDPSSTLPYIEKYAGKVSYIMERAATATFVGIYMAFIIIATGLGGLALNNASMGQAILLLLTVIPVALSYGIAVTFHKALYSDVLMKDFNEGNVVDRFNVYSMAKSANNKRWLTSYKMTNLKTLGEIELLEE
jgi:hypothetical protein